MKLNVGVDLHKSQFTVYWKLEKSREGKFARFADH